MFRVGQKVVCIIESHRWETFGCAVPEAGRVYTICALDPSEELLCLCLQELDEGYPSYWATGFRPVSERSTDISVFQAMLKPKKQTADNRLDSALHDHGFDPPAR